MNCRFFLPEPFDRPNLELAGSEAHHLLHVLRMKVGDMVLLFDGRGNEATARIVSLKRKSAELEVMKSGPGRQATTLPITLATAVPKGDRFRWLVEKTTELGVQRLIPLETTNSVVEPRDTKLEKMKQTVIAACKQSWRSRLMPIESVTSWADLIEREFTGRRVYVAHPAAKPLMEVMPESGRSDEPILLCVGPEGGFTVGEVEQAAHAGAQLVDLGAHTLRIETAAVALASFFVFHYRSPEPEFQLRPP